MKYQPYDRYFYLHDRLGSVRQISHYNRSSYTYGPFGEMFATECTENTDNPFKFTGQYYDSEIGQYYLRARQYDPQLMRFTGRDPADGKNEIPLSLHKYLYCEGNPVNKWDPSGHQIILPPSPCPHSRREPYPKHNPPEKIWRTGATYKNRVALCLQIKYFIDEVSC